MRSDMSDCLYTNVTGNITETKIGWKPNITSLKGLSIIVSIQLCYNVSNILT